MRNEINQNAFVMNSPYPSRFLQASILAGSLTIPIKEKLKLLTPGILVLDFVFFNFFYYYVACRK